VQIVWTVTQPSDLPERISTIPSNLAKIWKVGSVP
jgi:hypothetical protein